MSLDQQAADHPISRFAHRADSVLDQLLDNPTWSLTAEDSRRMLLLLTRLQARVGELRLRVLAAADSLDVGADSGCTSTAAWLADRTKVTRAQAHADVRLARQLDEPCGATRLALADGALHEDQARVIVAAVADLPDDVGPADRRRAEEHLIGLARDYDARILRRLGRRVFEVIAPDEADRREGAALEREEALARRRTSLRMRDNGDGTWSGSFKVPDLHAAMLRKALHAFTAPRRLPPESATREALGGPMLTSEVLGLGFTRLLEQFPVDRLPKAGGINASVVVTMTLEQLRTELGAAGLDTGERITAGEARRLACQAGIIPAVLGGASHVLDLGRRRRFHNGSQRLALGLRDRGCTAESCDRPVAWTEAHHEVAWSAGGPTSVRDGRLLCARHHRLAHAAGYQMTRMPNGKVRFHRRT